MTSSIGCICSLRTAQAVLDRITFLKGSSIDLELFDSIAKSVTGRRVLVILDSRHTKDHVLSELKLYSSLVEVGGYVLVNDTGTDNSYGA